MCEYCEGKGIEFDVVALDTGDANYPNVFINTRGEMNIITDSREYMEADDLWMVRINYCPMCGRRLAERGK